MKTVSSPPPFVSEKSNSGIRPEKATKIYVSNAEFQPSLAYVDVQITSPDNSHLEDKLEVRALHDSGCMKSVMRTSVYEKLLEQGNITLNKPENKIVLVSCTGEHQEVTGLADIKLHFTDEAGVSVSFDLNVVVHNQLSQDFLLGRDFTGSDAKAFETNEYLYLTDKYDIYLDSVKNSIFNKELCKVPLVHGRMAPMHVAANKMIIIPPFSSYVVDCSLKKSDAKKYRLPLETKGLTTYQVVNSTIPRVKSLPIVLQYDKPNCISIPLYNSTHEDIVVDEGEMVAEIDIWKNNVEVHEAKFHSDSEENVTLYHCNEVQTQHPLPSFISDDSAMNDLEKEESFLDYLRKGYHHPSMTKIVEDKAALTELYLKSTEPIPDELFESQFDVAHLPAKEQAMAYKSFWDNKEAFSKHACDIGCSTDITMSIPLTCEQPHIQKYIPIPHNLRPQVKAVLDQMLEFGLIRECDEPSMFCSNLLVVKKKDGKNIRILLDGRLLNNYTRRLPAQYVNQHEIFAHLVGKKFVTTIDLSDAFFQIMLDDESQPLTAFYSTAHGKRYCFTRAAQGLRNSPLHLKLLMDKLFGDMAGEVIHYADDILIATNGTLRQHLFAVSKVLSKLKKGNIKIRPTKLNLARNTIEFLGVVWTKGKISIPEIKILAFTNLPSPTTPKKSKSVICALSYYRKFIPNFADLARPIMELGSIHPKQFKWTDTHELCFRTLISHICKNSVLHLPDPTKPYYVQTDASQYAGAGRVYQKSDAGDERILACVSRTFTKTERAYSTIKKEVLALLYTLKTMDFFLQSAVKVVILVDAQAILHLRLCRESSGILLRFSLELSRYDAEIVHVPGEDNEISDVLSRHHIGIDKVLELEKKTRPMTEKQSLELINRLKCPTGLKFTKEEVAFMLDAASLPGPDGLKKRKTTAKTGVRDVKNTPVTLHNRKIKMPKEVSHAPGAKLPLSSCSILPESLGCNSSNIMSYSDFTTVSRAVLTGTLTPEQFKTAQAEDDFCSQVLPKVKTLKKYTIIDGLLFFKTRTTLKLVLPNSLLDVVINAKHFSIFGLHYSKTRIMRDISARYHVQNSVLSEKLKMLRENCMLCQFNSTGKQDQELRSTDYIFAPTASWSVDLIPNMPLSTNGFKAIFLAVDLFTGYIQLYPLRDRTTKSLIEAVDRTIIGPHGIPKFLRSDNEPGIWNSKEFFEYLKPLGINFLPTSVGAPWANSHAERSVRSIKEAARTFLQQEKTLDKWDLYASYFTNAHNLSTSVYGYSPFELMHGFHKPSPFDLIQFWPNARNPDDYMQQIIPLAEEMREIAQDRANKAKARNRSYKNQSRVDKKFLLGQLVMHRQLQVATGSGMGTKPKFNGPYVILSFNDDGKSAILEHLHTNVQMRGHFTNMSVLNFHPKANRVHTNFDNDIQHMIDLLGDKSTIHTKTRRPVDFPTDPMDDSPPDSVIARFVDENVDPILNVPDTSDLIDLHNEPVENEKLLTDSNMDNSNINFDQGKLIDDPFSFENVNWNDYSENPETADLIDLNEDLNNDETSITNLDLNNENDSNIDFGKINEDPFSFDNFDYQTNQSDFSTNQTTVRCDTPIPPNFPEKIRSYFEQLDKEEEIRHDLLAKSYDNSVLVFPNSFFQNNLVTTKNYYNDSNSFFQNNLVEHDNSPSPVYLNNFENQYFHSETASVISSNESYDDETDSQTEEFWKEMLIEIRELKDENNKKLEEIEELQTFFSQLS